MDDEQAMGHDVDAEWNDIDDCGYVGDTHNADCPCAEDSFTDRKVGVHEGDAV